MKKIALYKDGSIGFIETDSKHTVKVNGQSPTTLLEATDENIKKYFGDIKLPDDSTVVV